MKISKPLAISGVSLVLGLLAFQNCSQTNFQAAPGSASADSHVAPLCQPVTADAVRPKLKWDWYSQLATSPDSQYPDFNQVMAAPMVGDLEGGGHPSVVFTSFSTHSADFYADSFGPSYLRNGVLRIVDGATGQNKLSVGDTNLAPFSAMSPLLMDIDGDGKMEIFYVHYSGKYIIALNSDGSLRWRYSVPNSALTSTFLGLTAGPRAANGIGSLLAGSWVISEDASRSPVLLFTAGTPVSLSATTLFLPLDPAHPDQWNLVNSSGIYKGDGTLIASFPSGVVGLAAADLFPEVPGIEVVATGGGKLRIFNGLTGDVLRDVDLKQYNDLLCPSGSVGGGPPSVGNFDGEGTALEIAVATGRHLTIFDRDGVPIYKTVTQDCSSLVTGLTTFDLNGDKKPEVLYADEQYLRVFEVINGVLQVDIQLVNPSGTLFEYPVVADIDNSGSSSLVVVANNYAVGGFYTDPAFAADKAAAAAITGVRAFTSSTPHAWMPSRPIWNQYSFHPDLVDDHGRVATAPLWDASFFRRNNQGYRTLLQCSSSGG